jgi:hypothetical protein
VYRGRYTYILLRELNPVIRDRLERMVAMLNLFRPRALLEVLQS